MLSSASKGSWCPLVSGCARFLLTLTTWKLNVIVLSVNRIDIGVKRTFEILIGASENRACFGKTLFPEKWHLF
jgi:hypothetical protein